MSETPSIPHLQDSSAVRARLCSWFAGLQTRGRAVRSWLSVGEPVLLSHPDGTQSIWRGGARLPDAANVRAPKFTAIQLPEELVLRRSLVLPRMSETHVAEALRLEARSNSPFPVEELAWGSLVRELEGGKTHVDLALASRRHVARFMQERWPELVAAAQQPEVWSWSVQDPPVIIQGYGEVHRVHAAVLGRRWNWALAGVVLALATMAALTPTIQLRLRAVEAVGAFDSVLRRVAPLVRKRDELAALNDKVRSMDLIVAERVDPAGVMDYLTRILPDDTYLYGLDVQKTKITASGHTVDASALLQKLSSDPRLKNVRAPMAVTRQPGATKEAFVIEFAMEPAVAAANPLPAAAAVVPPAAAVPSVVAASAAAPVAAPVGAAAAPKQMVPVSPPPGSSPFVIGGSR